MIADFIKNLLCISTVLVTGNLHIKCVSDERDSPALPCGEEFEPQAPYRNTSATGRTPCMVEQGCNFSP